MVLTLEMDEVDPGWRRAVVDALVGLVPVWGMRHRKKGWQTSNGVSALRGLFLSFVTAIAMIGIVAWVLGRTRTKTGSAPVTFLAILVVVAGVAALFGAQVFARPLRCDDEADLVASYRSRFFVRIAFAEAPALVAFAATVASGKSWLYAMGAFFAAIGFARVAPTAGHMAQDQEEVRRSGCGLLLLPALARARQGQP